MFGPIGVPELLILLVLGLVWIAPIVIIIWVIVTLHRIRASQQSLEARMAAIERAIQRP